MKILRRLLIVALVVVLLFAAGGYWILGTPGGAELVLGRVAGMIGKGAKIEGVAGSLGGPLHVKLIVVDRPDFFVRIEDVEIDSSPFAPLRGRLIVYKLYARSVEVRTAGAAGAARMPMSFKPPYSVRLDDGRIGTFTTGHMSRKGEDLVLRDILLKGEGDETHYRIS